MESLSKAPPQFIDVTAERLFPATFNLMRSFSFVGDPSYEIDSEEPVPVSASRATEFLPGSQETGANPDDEPES